jgi:hypothetical protein
MEIATEAAKKFREKKEREGQEGEPRAFSFPDT